jgi:hypothetical protein
MKVSRKFRRKLIPSQLAPSWNWQNCQLFGEYEPTHGRRWFGQTAGNIRLVLHPQRGNSLVKALIGMAG